MRDNRGHSKNEKEYPHGLRGVLLEYKWLFFWILMAAMFFAGVWIVEGGQMAIEFTGVKMIIEFFDIHVDILLSIGIICGLLAVGIILSVVISKMQEKASEEDVRVYETTGEDNPTGLWQDGDLE